MAQEFWASYKNFPPGVDHDTVIICQHSEPSPGMREMFEEFANAKFYIHDDKGWDIGGYIALAKSGLVKTDFMICCGGSTTVRREGWMKRMVESWDKYGEGFYGSLSSYQIRPHFNTNGFWTSPRILAEYPFPINTHADRYGFEHGPDACWIRVHESGLPAKLVTWDGEYDWPEWRSPNNISCRGDQSACLMFFRINYQYELYQKHDPGALNNLMYLTDAHLLDDKFKR